MFIKYVLVLCIVAAITNVIYSMSIRNPNQNAILEARQILSNKPCICIPLNQCPPLFALLSIRPHPETVEFLKNQTCGFKGLDPYVCCFEIPPRYPHPRFERCMASSEDQNDDFSSSRMSNSNEIKQDHHTNLHPRYFPSRSSFHDGMTNHRRFEKYPIPHFHKHKPEVTTTEIPDTRSRLVPDLTCGISLDQRIIGGKDAKLGAYPWIARIGYTRSREASYLYRCGGALINSKFVLTAAHCINGLPVGLTLATVRLGEQDERSDPDCDGEVCADSPQDFTPIVVIAHRNYNVPKYKNDVGLIRLDREATITPYVSPICLPFNFMQTTNYTGIDTIAAGWGTVSMATTLSYPNLQDVTLKIANLADCTSIYKSRFNLSISAEQLCTVGQNNIDTCEGDSGGPLMRFEQIEKNGVPRYYMLGIISFGPKHCGTANIPGVFTKVSSYLDWILLNIDDE